jgi:hypothetical protein
MAIGTKSAEEYARRWAEACWLAICDALERPRTQEQYERALSLAAVNLPKVIARRGRGVAINLSAAAARAIGLEAGKRVLVLPLPEGGGFLRRHQRDLASNRASWRRRGKLTPSYRRKLKGAGLTGGSPAGQDLSLALPFGGETQSEGSATQPAAVSLLPAPAPRWPVCMIGCPDSTQ